MCGAYTLSPSSKFPIAYVEIRAFSHATEDLDKVEAAVRNVLSEALVEGLTFTKTSLTGHYGNPIVFLDAKLENKAALPSLLQKIGASVSSLDKEQFAAEFSKHVEKHNLYLRLDKQSAFLGSVKMAAVDAIHLKIHFKNQSEDGIAEFCKQVGLLP
jgi:RNA binding exosome subunit